MGESNWLEWNNNKVVGGKFVVIGLAVVYTEVIAKSTKPLSELVYQCNAVATSLCDARMLFVIVSEVSHVPNFDSWIDKSW